MNNYKNEVSERFGDTNAYKEFIQKTAGYTETDFADSGEGLSRIFIKFAECKTKGNSPESEEAKALVKELKEFISENFYTCTDEILKGLGVMYTADERFKVNIDSHSEGTANFISKAIECCCKQTSNKTGKEKALERTYRFSAFCWEGQAKPCDASLSPLATQCIRIRYPPAASCS